MRSEEALLLSEGFEDTGVLLGDRRRRRSAGPPAGMPDRRRRQPSRRSACGSILTALFLHALPVLAVACLGRLELLGTPSEGGSGWAHVTWVSVEGESGQAPPPPLPALPEGPPDAAAPVLPSRPDLPGDAGPGGPVAGEGESLGSSGELEAPVWNPRPAYPDSARKAGWEGLVAIEMEVGPDGRVVQARILSSSGHEILDRAALAALSRWRFAPRRSSSVKILHQEVVFRLET